MTLHVCLNIWNEELMLPECIDSVRKFLPEAKIVAVDGAYKSFVNEVKKRQAHYIEYRSPHLAEALDPFTIPQSTDKTLEILKEKEVDVIIECQKNDDGNSIPWEHEYVKRSKYFVGKQGDFYLVLDADERIEGTIDLESLKDDAYNILLERWEEYCKPYPILRFFRHRDGIHYYGAHHALFMNGKLYKKEECKALDAMKIVHKQVYRSKKDPLRRVAKGLYYRYLTSCEEAGFRAQNGI